ncbi:ATP-dependent DNA helicase Q4 [Chamaea fasciata]|uniref:ATP-dependent DNA helicase Q4 n=1 Tax=Chamaea fasciata TaxID=190680 RepID=UPI00336A61A6
MERQQELRALLKRWEAQFLRERRRKPRQADIEEAPEETRGASADPSENLKSQKNPQNSSKIPKKPGAWRRNFALGTARERGKTPKSRGKIPKSRRKIPKS